MPKISSNALKPFWQTTDGNLVRLYHGDVLAVLKQLPAQSVHMVVTSPPYWGLRDYGTDKALEIGSEKTPQEFVAKMVEVFREVRRVLRDDGTCWLNLGDSYGGGPPGGQSNKQDSNRGSFGARSGNGGLKSGNLTGSPWRVALALQEDGWVLRQDIIWAKPSPMPESVKNRCTKSHEYVFLLTKSMRYFYDAEAIKDPSGNWNSAKSSFATPRPKSTNLSERELNLQCTQFAHNTHHPNVDNNKNKRSVWWVSSQGYEGAHFATFPEKLIEPCILAGTSAKGCCEKCGAPWKRVVEEKKLTRERPNDYVKRTGEEGTGNSCANSVAGVEVKTLGWEPTCECGVGVVVPCTVLDPFIGSGTTCCVAIQNGRRSVGIDLSEKYLRDNAIPRIEGELMSRPALARLTGRVAKKVVLGKTIKMG